MKKINALNIKSANARGVLDGLKSQIPPGFQPVSSYFCFRKNGNRIFENWYSSGNLEKDVKDAFRDARRKFTTVEICFSHSHRAAALHKLPGDIYRGIKGLKLSFKGEYFIISPSDMLARNIGFSKVAEQFYQSMKAEIDADHENFTAEVFDAYQYIILSGEEPRLTPIYRGNQIIPYEHVTRENVELLARQLSEWMFVNLRDNGELTYKYWPSAGKYSGKSNAIRMFTASICLLEAAKFYNDASMHEKAVKNLRFSLEKFLEQERNFAYINDNGKANLGAAALAAYAITLSGDGELSEIHNLLYNFTEMLQQPDGSFRTFYIPEELNNCQNLYPGECLFYWSVLFENTKSEILRERFLRAFQYYRNLHLSEPNPSFVPWHSQAYFNFLKVENNDEMHEFIYQMNNWLIPFQQWDGLKAADVTGRFYDSSQAFGAPHAAATGAYIQGLADAFRLADIDDRDQLAETYAQTIRRALRDVMQLAFTTEIDCYYINKKERVLGGVRTTEYNNEIRVDNVSQNLLGIFKLLKTEGFIWPSELSPREF